MANKQQVMKVSWTHDHIVDQMIANPKITQNELAKMFGYSPPYISVVVNSDAFRERLAMRREEIIDPMLIVTVNDRFNALTVRSLEVLQEKLSGPASVVDTQLALQAASLGAKAMGVGGFSARVVPVAPPPAEDKLAKLAGRLMSLMSGGAEDATVVENAADPRVGVGSCTGESPRNRPSLVREVNPLDALIEATEEAQRG